MRSITITDDVVNLVVNGKCYMLPRTSPLAAKVIDGYRRGVSDADLEDAADIRKQIFRFSDGIVSVEGDDITIQGKKVHGFIAERLLMLIKQGLPFDYLRNFWIRLNANPSKRAMDETYKFVEHKGMTITSMGMIRAYKAITRDWHDKWTGKLDYRLGNLVTMPRNEVCDDCRIGCGPGLHAGAMDFAVGYATRGGYEDGDRIVIVEIDPANVVSVPEDCSCQKMRCCAYRFIEEYQGILPDFADANRSSTYEPADDLVDPDPFEGDVLTVTTTEELKDQLDDLEDSVSDLTAGLGKVVAGLGDVAKAVRNLPCND